LHDTDVEALDMRKQDRIASQQQSRPQHSQAPGKDSQPEKKQQEQVKGGASQDQSARPPRQPGKLPLPD
jgi:hypothetical protein